MHDRTARVFAGLGVLVVVWIVVYWSWPVRDDGSSLGGLSAEFGADLDAGLADEDGLGAVPAREERFVPAPMPTRPAVISEPSNSLGDDRADGGADEAAGPAGGVIPPAFSSYTIRSGDNFERISQRVYGTRRHAMAIARSNPLLDPRKLKTGGTIRVPKDPANIQGIEVDAGTGGDSDGSGANGEATIEYTVKRGDTLSGISKAFYGSVSHVDFLYSANRGRMSSKDDLRLGQVLLIPPLPAGAD